MKTYLLGMALDQIVACVSSCIYHTRHPLALASSEVQVPPLQTDAPIPPLSAVTAIMNVLSPNFASEPPKAPVLTPDPVTSTGHIHTEIRPTDHAMETWEIVSSDDDFQLDPRVYSETSGSSA